MTNEPVGPSRDDPLTEPAAAPAAAARLAVVDKLRGLVIVLMVLDHVRVFFHAEAPLFSPTDPAKTYPLLFATRWVTHLCAPTFVLLAGVAIALQRERGKTGVRLARFLLARGFWLIALDAVFTSFGFNFGRPFAFLLVLYAIGTSMVFLAPLVWLPPTAVLALGLAIVFGHDYFASADPAHLGAWRIPWTLLMKPGPLGDLGVVGYPALPWFGIMAVGYGAGWIAEATRPRRDRLLVTIGLAMLALFLLLRAVNTYGDPHPWTAQASPALTAMSFLNVSKYPPSLLYTLVTLGVTISLTPVVDRLGGPLGRLLHTMGRTPLFIYLIHIYLVHVLAVLVGLAMGYSPGIFFGFMRDAPERAAAGWGVGLAWVYAIWIGVVLALWPLAAWYADLKARRRDWWLSFV